MKIDIPGDIVADILRGEVPPELTAAIKSRQAARREVLDILDENKPVPYFQILGSVADGGDMSSPHAPALRDLLVELEDEYLIKSTPRGFVKTSSEAA